MNADQPSVAPIFTSAETDATALGSAASGLMGGSSTLAESSPELMQGGAGEMSPDLTETELLPMSGGDDADKRKSTFTLIAVHGGSLPSASSKFVGTTPKAAVTKAARRIHKRSNKTEFSVIMRRVASRKVDKKLYKYAVVMRKRARPSGFVTLVDPNFVVAKTVVRKGETIKTKGEVFLNIAKKVPIVASSDHPVYGHVGEDGTLKKGITPPKNKFVVVRAPDTDTLYLVIPGAIPDRVNGVAVVKTEWEVAKLQDVPLSDEERDKYDVAGKAKLAADEHAKKVSDNTKRIADKRRQKERDDKEKAKASAKAAREKERAKKAAAKAKEAEKKAKKKA